MKKTLQAANIIALIITILMNYLSNTGIFNRSTMASVSAEYQNYFTPAGYAFSIWGLIYIGLIAFIVYQSKGLFSKAETPSVVLEVGWLFVISCAANCLWILAWLYNYTGTSVIVMILLLFSLMRIVISTRMELDYVPLKRIVFVWWPFSLYVGWITVALLANFAAYLAKIQWDGFGISGIYWTILFICIAGITHIFLTWNRNMREAAFAAAWGLIAVAVTNANEFPTIVYTAIIVAIILIISSIVHGFRSRKRHLIKLHATEK
ncbi:hypothetical protein [Albibacterium sp.]|uniref:hypothetical protein n=1 Tax=Albibacterium sp. TaxID=2952885 RepID=UPI002C1468CC|nr:hypothetical protein [Albibacterium sp.]HUH19466.1 hypothetical protein [Albibacterium sp.]